MAIKALVLDDSRAMRSVLAKMLAHFGFETIQAAQGLEGLAVMDRRAVQQSAWFSPTGTCRR